MKKMKFVAALVAFFSVIGLGSCMNGGDSGYDLTDYMTVTKDDLGKVCLVGDFTGLTFYPANSTVLNDLLLSTGNYYKRAYAGVKLAEEFVQGKKSYYISELLVSYAIPYMGFNTRKDTLSGDYGFGTLNKAWARTGFVNVDFNVNVESSNINTFYNDLHMYVTRASQDTLYTKLRYVKPTETGQNYTLFVSFYLPEDCMEYNQLVPKNDSIIIKVESEGKWGEQLQVTTPYCYSDLRN